MGNTRRINEALEELKSTGLSPEQTEALGRLVQGIDEVTSCANDLALELDAVQHVRSGDPLHAHYPYKAALMYEDSNVWWPESSSTHDSMVIGDGIPGDKKTAELCARCCNIAYQHAVDDVMRLMKSVGVCADNAAQWLLDRKKRRTFVGQNTAVQRMEMAYATISFEAYVLMSMRCTGTQLFPIVFDAGGGTAVMSVVLTAAREFFTWAEENLDVDYTSRDWLYAIEGAFGVSICEAMDHTQYNGDGSIDVPTCEKVYELLLAGHPYVPAKKRQKKESK